MSEVNFSDRSRDQGRDSKGRTVMEFLQSNWIWFVFIGLFVWMMVSRRRLLRIG